MRAVAVLVGLYLGCASGFHLVGSHAARAGSLRASRAQMDSADTRPAVEMPEGVEFKGTTSLGEPIFCNDQGCWIAGTVSGVTEDGAPIFCAETGCWLGLPPGEELPPPPVTLPDGRTISTVDTLGVDVKLGKEKESKKKKSDSNSAGLFAPVVMATADVMGRKELNKLRADVIAKHTEVISAFVDTSESEFGRIVLRKMFEAADKDDNGTLDREEVRDALHALGFTFIENKTLDKIMDRADVDGNEVIDFEEFVTETPKTLRMSLIKLAKKNGHDLGFLA